MTKIDKDCTRESEVGIMKELKEMQENLERRTEVENKAIQLISECQI